MLIGFENQAFGEGKPQEIDDGPNQEVWCFWDSETPFFKLIQLYIEAYWWLAPFCWVPALSSTGCGVQE
eukprot:2538356-Amphidinium_carterae.1